MELNIYSKQLDLKYNVKINQQKKVNKIGFELLNRYQYPNKIQFSIFHGDFELDLNKTIEHYQLNNLSNLSIIFTNKVEITLIHKFFGNLTLTVETWDKFIELRNKIQMQYKLSENYEICLRTNQRIWCLEFLLVHENIHNSQEIYWEAYDIINYEFENKNYKTKIEISDDWSKIINNIKETLKTNKIIQINSILPENNTQSIDPKSQFYLSKFSSQVLLQVIIPEKVNVQIALKDQIKLINVQQEEKIRNLIEIAQQAYYQSNDQCYDLYYEGNKIELDYSIYQLNLNQCSVLELKAQKNKLIKVKFLNTKMNEIIEKQVDINSSLIRVIEQIKNKNCNKCEDFKIIVKKNEVDQNLTFSDLDIDNQEIISYECNAIEINFIFRSQNFQYHAKKSHTLLSLEQEVKNNYQEIIPHNFSIFQQEQSNGSNYTLEELGIKDQNVTYTFLLRQGFSYKIMYENQAIKLEFLPNRTVGQLEKIIAQQFSVDISELQSFYGYIPLNKDEELRNIFFDRESTITIQRKKQMKIYLQDIVTDEQRMVQIYLDDPVKLIFEKEGLGNIKLVKLNNQPIDINACCLQLQIVAFSTLCYELFQ